MSEKKDKLLSSLSNNLPTDIQSKQVSVKDERDLDDDYVFSRDNYRDLVDQSKQAIDLMMELARESEHPRAFEVLSGMIKQSADVTDKLMDLQKKKKDIKVDSSKKTNGDSNNVTNNNLFVGSTTDLQRFLLNRDNGVIDGDHKE
jgi:hypothetical protein